MPGKTHKIVVLGAKSTGKTAVIEQALYGNLVVGDPLPSTIEDTYIANVLSDKGIPEHLRFYDTAGLDCQKPNVPKHYYSLADAFILVYDITRWETFHCLNALKADIEKYKEKKETPTVLVLGNKRDLAAQSRQIDVDTVQKWAHKEKVILKEVSVDNRKSLMEAFSLLASRLAPVSQKSGLSIKSHFKKAASQGGSITAIGPAADV